MIKNIQRYLLTNYPLLWNIKVVPMLLILTGVHLFFFSVGYSAVDTRFEYSSSYYSPFNEISELTYFACILVGILILIGWLVFYNRNNSFKTFYPRRHIHVYIEWLLIWGITAGIAFTPITIMYGNLSAWRFIMPKSEAIKSVELSDKVTLLIPNGNDGYFRFNTQKDKVIPIPDKANLIVDSLDLDLYSFDYNRKGELIINGYTGNSLLFYSKNGYYDKNEIKDNVTSEVEEIKQWLVNGDKEKICALMSEYLAHLEKYKFPANITTEEWYNQINKPPFFSIDSISLSYSDDEKSLSTQHRILSGGHKRIISSYENDEITNIILICLCISLLLSVFIFSSRVTSGKTWLTSMVVTGVLFLFSVLFGVSGFYALSTVFFWILLFIIALAHVIIQIKEGYKGKSKISVNVFLWIIPAIVPITYFSFESITYNSHYDNISFMFWINIPLSIILMWFATKVIHRWKGIAEE